MMRGFLLDTKVISELQRPSPNASVVAWLHSLSLVATHLSAVTIGELWGGVARASNDVFRARLTRWIEVDVRRAYRGRVLPIDERVARIWGEIHAANRAQPVNVIDEMIAATAAANGLTVATRNIRDFERCGVSVINPWEFEV